MTTQIDNPGLGALAIAGSNSERLEHQARRLPLLASRRTVAEAVSSALGLTAGSSTGLTPEIRSAINQLPILTPRKIAAAFVADAVKQAAASPQRHPVPTASAPPPDELSGLAPELQQRIAALPVLGTPSPTSAANHAQPAPTAPQRPALAGATAPVASPSPAVASPPAAGIPKAESVQGMPHAISALCTEELAITGIRTLTSDGRGHTIEKYPTADLRQVYKIVTSGERVLLSTRSPGFVLSVWQEITTRPILQRVEGTPRLRDVLPADLEKAAKQSSDDIVAAINTPTEVLDRLGATSRFDGTSLAFDIVAGEQDNWTFTTGNPIEAQIVYSECKAAGVPVQVTARHFLSSFVWLKYGNNKNEIWATHHAARAKAEAETQAQAVQARAAAEIARIHAPLRAEEARRNRVASFASDLQ